MAVAWSGDMTGMNRVCIITGGSRGIGAACARLAAKAGYAVCFSYISNPDAASAVVADIEKAGMPAKAIRADVAHEEDILALFDAAAEMGTLKGLINNAGIVAEAQDVADYTRERLEKMVAINLVGAILCAREAVRRMSTKRGGDGGSIVNLSSAAAYLAAPSQYVDYAATKAAIDTFTKGLALEVADEGIRVNAVRPGLIETDIHASGGQPDRVEKLQHLVPMKRGGTADEVARGILWLMSEEASYVTGDSMNITGGR
jgi:NAD(P)-dependent dehydrogenase (short-subunit alcohol dehydrogenase family)